MSEDSSEDIYDEDIIEEDDDENIKLKTHQKIKKYLCGEVETIKENYSKVKLSCTKEMTVDEMGLVHGGFTFGAADFAAMAAVNEPYVVLTSSSSKFLAPAKVGDVIIFEAEARFEDARKREISVIGTINEIKIFEGVFDAVILSDHILKLKIKELKNSKQEKEKGQNS